MIINDVSIEKGDLANPEVDDLLDDLGEMVTKMGVVMIIPHKKCQRKVGCWSVSLLKFKHLLLLSI
jgi:hypothetical protein